VTDAAFRLAQDALRDTFAAEEKVTTEREIQRRRTEKVFFVRPDAPPKLFDESIWTGRPRTEEELAIAEQRLQSLGFEREINENIVCYKLKQEPYSVLADLRALGRIDFVVYIYANENKKGKKRIPISEFYMLDTWKNKIPEKFKLRLEGAIKSLSRAMTE
jgi:hypothetical protein